MAGGTGSDFCNFQRIVDPVERLRALARGACDRCGATAAELARRGERLEVCGDEYMTDADGTVTEFEVVALCPRCHRLQHLDGAGRHQPCQVTARRSRESF